MEGDSGAKIAIRGKGSVKEGKGRSDAAHSSNQEEDLHCLIMADTEEKINKAKQLIHNVIETVRASPPYPKIMRQSDFIISQAASIPEGQNELKRNQLRELAALNGTLRDDENQACQNCGQIGHRKYDCPEQRNFTANIICRVCGNAGHMARDCPDRQRGQNWRNEERGGFAGAGGRPAGRLEPADTEFNNLMQELGAGGAVGAGAAPGRIEAGGADGYGDSGAPKPWQRGPSGAPAPWAQGGGGGRDRDGGGSGGPAPWAQGGGGRGHDSYGGGYGHSSGAAPWQQSAPPPPPAAASGGGYGGGYGGYGYGGYGAPGYEQGGYGGAAAAPGMAPWQQAGYGNAGSPPPPPPPGDAAPPVSDSR